MKKIIIAFTLIISIMLTSCEKNANEYEQIKEKLKYDSTSVTTDIRYVEDIVEKVEIDFLDTTA